MRPFLPTFVVLALAVAPLSAVAPPVIPQVHAQLLTGAPINLPADLHGKPTILVLGFSQGSRDQVTGWAQRLGPDYRDAPDVAYYEAADLEPVPRVLRGWVTKKIRETMPAPAQTHFLTLTDHESEWKSAAGFTTGDDAYLLLLDRDGTIRWTTHGPTSDQAYTALKQHLEPLRTH